MRISHEAIYQALYVQGRGALRRELTACLRTGRALRVPRARTRDRARLRHPRDDDQRTAAEAEDRAVPGHWEGDLIVGLNSSAIGTLVERTTRFTMLLHLPPMEGHGPAPGEQRPALAGTARRRSGTRSPRPSRPCPGSYAGRSPGTRARRWPATRSCASTPASRSTSATRTAPGSAPRTRTPTGCCASTSRRGPTSARSADDLAAVAAALNGRPRKTLSWKTPGRSDGRAAGRRCGLTNGRDEGGGRRRR